MDIKIVLTGPVEMMNYELQVTGGQEEGGTGRLRQERGGQVAHSLWATASGSDAVSN